MNEGVESRIASGSNKVEALINAAQTIYYILGDNLANTGELVALNSF